MLCCSRPTFTSSSEALMGDDFGIHELLTSIDQLRAKADGKDQDLAFLSKLLQSQEFRSLVKVHEMVTTPEGVEAIPVHSNLASVLNEVFSAVLSHSSILEIEELLILLSTSHFKAFVRAHDQVAAKDFQPQLPDIPFEVDEDDDIAVKIVRLVKGPNEPLGATIHKDDETGVISIARIMYGGAADRCGLIHIGDIVKEVNGVRVTGKSPEEVVKLLTSATGPVTMTLMPGYGDADAYKETQMRVRAHFSYDPKDDRSIPCHDVGLSFKRGDILEIVCQDDPFWWQARKEGDSRNVRAGLIPNRMLLERKEATRIAEVKNNIDNKNHKSFLRFGSKSGSKLNCVNNVTKKQTAENDVEEGLEMFYEEVARYSPRPEKYRPIILLGPPGVGRTELKQRLISSNPSHFCATILYTSRPKRPNESDGSEYYFLSRREMETDMQNKRFVDCSEYKGHLYATEIDQIKSIINDGRVCVLTPRPQALKTLRCPDLKPFVIFIKPPSTLEKLMDTRRTVARKRSPSISSLQTSFRHFVEEELREMFNASTKLESFYGSYFDHVIVNEDLEEAGEELCGVARAAEEEPFWVPSSWIH